jgi:hypothetical protein
MIKLNKKDIIDAIRYCNNDEEMLFKIIQQAYNSGYKRGRDDTIDQIFTECYPV